MKNIEKINLIIEKYRDNEFKYFEDFYKQILFFDAHEAITLCEVTPENIQKPEFIHKILTYHGGETKIVFNNYILFQVGNVNGISLMLLNKDIDLKNSSPYNIFLEKIYPKGLKLYIDTNFYELKQKQYIDVEQKYFYFNGKKYQLDDLCYRNGGIYPILLYNRSQRYLTEAFLEELFIEIDKSNFIDCLAMKYYPYEKRKDRINIYISSFLRENKHLLNQFLSIIKDLVYKYQQQGLQFHKDQFIMPYEFDENRFIANTYVADSFNKSLLILILLYMKKDEKWCKDFFYCHDVYNYNKKDLNVLKSYIRNLKNITFEDLVFEILDKFKIKHQKDYLLTYSKVFKF
ncbi:hypothetical protein JCM12298_02080 [Desulfothermus naphthae]